MEHCLGRYALRCAFRRSFAVSIRTGGGFKLSSALLDYDLPSQVSIADHSAYRNAMTDPRAEIALERFIEAIASDASAIGDFECARLERVADYGGDSNETRALYQFTLAPAREWKFRAFYAPLLPKSEGALGRDDWLKLKGLDRVVATLVDGGAPFLDQAAA